MNRAFAALRRSTTSGGYIPVIDGLRFAAITSVVLFHVQVQMTFAKSWDMSGVWWAMIAHGFRGVPLFFTISGFILAIPFARQWLGSANRVPLGKYFLRRLTRLEPPYIAIILIRVLLLLFVAHKPFRNVFGRAVATLFYAHSLTFGTISTVNPPAWSLAVEAQFYLLAPFLAAAYFRIPGFSVRLSISVLITLASGAIQIWVTPANRRKSIHVEFAQLSSIFPCRIRALRRLSVCVGKDQSALGLGYCFCSGLAVDISGEWESRPFASSLCHFRYLFSCV